MRFAITGEAGFIATNLQYIIKKLGHEFVSLSEQDTLSKKLQGTNEPCVYSNSEEAWTEALKENNVDVLIHNAAVVGTDVVALNAEFSSLSNVTGTHTISRSCRKAGVPVCYMGTTVIYDTARYQDTVITEESALNPKTFYGIQKLAGEQIVKHNAKDWMIIRPLFAYGGFGDMNSLIAKSIYACLNNSGPIDMFLDPAKIKDYMHVLDFCEAIVRACELGLWGEDYNVSAETPFNTNEIVEIISSLLSTNINQIVSWHPSTDYLGNHVLSSRKFRTHTGWAPKIKLSDGIQDSFTTILNNDGTYNPLKHLQEAKERGVDLLDYY